MHCPHCSLLSTHCFFITPTGIKSRMQLSRDFLKRKLDEYEMLKMEIEELKKDLETFPIPKGEGAD